MEQQLWQQRLDGLVSRGQGDSPGHRDGTLDTETTTGGGSEDDNHVGARGPESATCMDNLAPAHLESAAGIDTLKNVRTAIDVRKQIASSSIRRKTAVLRNAFHKTHKHK